MLRCLTSFLHGYTPTQYEVWWPPTNEAGCYLLLLQKKISFMFFIIAQYLMTGRALVFFPWFYFLNSSDFSGLALLSESIWLWPTSYQPPQGSRLPVKSPGIYSCPPYPGCSHLIDSLSPEYSHSYYSATLVETKWHLMSLLYILVMWISELTFCSLLAYNFFF